MDQAKRNPTTIFSAVGGAGGLLAAILAQVNCGLWFLSIKPRLSLGWHLYCLPESHHPPGVAVQLPPQPTPTLWHEIAAYVSTASVYPYPIPYHCISHSHALAQIIVTARTACTYVPRPGMLRQGETPTIGLEKNRAGSPGN